MLRRIIQIQMFQNKLLIILRAPTLWQGFSPSIKKGFHLSVFWVEIRAQLKVFMFLLYFLYVLIWWVAAFRFLPCLVRFFPITPGKLAGPFQGFLFNLQNKTDGILSVRFIWWR